MNTRVTEEIAGPNGVEVRAMGAGLGGAVGGRWIMLWLVVGALGIIFLRLPIALDFKMFGFYDPGAALKADAFLWEGRLPTVDFAYSYGLLPLEVGRVWYWVFGRTPWGHERMIVAATMVMVLGMAQLGAALRWNGVALGVAVLALPVALTEVYLNQTHVIEAGLLTWALAFQAMGQRRWALAVTAICLFVKPSMAYAYGLILVILIVRECWRGRVGWWGWVREFLPAAAVLVGLAAVLIRIVGWLPVGRTLVPLSVQESYRAAHFGFFFGVGRDFWWRVRGDYFSTVAAFWMAATVFIVGFAVRMVLSGVARRRVTQNEVADRKESAGRETFLCIVAMHLIFVFLLYAWADSWTYYAFLLVIATATAVNFAGVRWGVRWAAGLGLLLLVMLGFKVLEWSYAWNRYRGVETDGLWAYQTMVDDWRAARQKAEVGGRGRTLWLVNGDLAEMFPGMQVPECWFMGPAFLTAGELAAVKKQIAEADVVVRFAENGPLDPWLWDAFREETGAFREELSNAHFIVEVRKQAEGNRQ